MEGFWIKTRNPLYKQICQFWIKIFALTFGMGVVSGIVMEFQLGTNWSGFTRQIGDILGPLFVYEVMSAFFIEAGALGVMIFGWDKVGDRLHYLSTVLVLLGTTLSAYWIMSANTWMQHPVGYTLINGKFAPSSWLEVLFNPFTFSRLFHMLLASYISAFFVVLGISAYYLKRQQHMGFAKTSFKFAAVSLFIMLPVQMYLGDMAGRDVYKYQPLKTAAMEGAWNTEAGAPLLLFAIPDQKEQVNYYEVSIPHLASLLNTHNWNGTLTGLKTVAPQDQPPVLPVFFSFRVMVGLGVLMLFLSWVAFYLAIINKHPNSKFLPLFTYTAPIGFVALWCGWITAEIGRQPWIVYNLIRTTNAVSKINLHDIIISFGLIIIVYGIIFGYFYFYFLSKTIKHGPSEIEKTKEIKEPFQYMPNVFSKETK
jgi:cytochrome d ubiquinol oxidase subunit I